MLVKLIRCTSFVAVLVLALLGACHAASADRERPLNANWSFLRGDAVGAEQPQFNDATVRVRILNARGRAVATGETTCAVARAGATADLSPAVAKPGLWSPASPVLYRAEVTVLAGGKTVDVVGTSFGIRSLAWNAQRGFLLNGESIKLRGGCIHHDFGPLGSASFPRAEERRVATLKAAGYNAIRCSHNMPSTAFLEACDRLGMLVVDEAFDMWNQSKTPQDYARFFKADWQRDLDAMVRRDRNHPCVVMWSIGNEIPERFEASGRATAEKLADHIRTMDSSRPVTAAFNDVSEKADPFLASLDISGYNYCPDSFVADHQRQPQRVMFTTESFPRDSFTYWSRVEQFPYVVGDFVWTAWDYRGEAAIGHTVPEGATGTYLLGWPYHNAFCGDFDVCGFVKPQGLYRQVLWDARRVAILVEDSPPGRRTKPDLWGWRDEQPSWTWPGLEGQTRTVHVYAKGDRVRLKLNGKEVGTHEIGPQHTAQFSVVYAPGELSAEVLKDGKLVAKDHLVTAGAPAALKLTAEESTIPTGTDHIAFIAVEAVDGKGITVPIAANNVRASVAGAGTLAAFGNGDPRNVSSVQQNTQNLWRGRALLVVRSNGARGLITIKAEANGLKPARAAIHVWEPELQDESKRPRNMAWSFKITPVVPSIAGGEPQEKPPFELFNPSKKLSYRGHECQWNGPGWPFATAVTLTAMANLLNGAPQEAVSKRDYFDLLRIYARSHRLKLDDGSVVPWIDENINPFTGDWISRTRLKSWENGTWSAAKGGVERGKDYNHSTYRDLIITGLVGLRPRPDDTVGVNPLVPQSWDYFCLDQIPYHGLNLTVLFDKTGSHYGKGKGLRVFADGKEIAASENLTRVTGPLPPPAPLETSGGWKKFEGNPVMGGKYGTCFDVSVLREGGTYRMWLSWRPKASVALVESKEGIHWSEPPQVVLGPRKETGWEDDINRPYVLKRDDTYHMWYTGQVKPGARDGHSWIGYATSPDGLTWEKYEGNPVFGPEPKNSWEKHKVTACQVEKRGDWYVVFYIGFQNESTARICLARSKDGITNWQRHPGNPIIFPGKDKWDHDACYKPYAVFDGTKWLLWYNGRHGSLEQIGVVLHEGEDLGFDQ